MKIIINPAYNSLDSFIKEVPSFFDREGTIIYNQRNRLKTYCVDNTTVVVKRFRVPFFINRIIYTFFRSTKARRSFEYASMLLMKGIRTPDPVAYIEEKKMGLIHYSFYICLFEHELTHIRRQMLLEPWNKPFQKELALFVAELHSQGILFLDLSPGNILYQEKDNQPVFSLVDINRMKFKANLSLKERYKNFMRLSGNLEIMTELAREYARACSLDEKKTISHIIGYCATFNNKKWFRNFF